MHTNSTSNYELSQFVGTDKPTFLGDYNGDMLKIDTAIAGVDAKAIGADSKAGTAITAANTASDTASGAETLANTANTNANSALATAGNAATAASAAQSSADAASAKAGDLTQLTTTDKTSLVDAINEVNAKPAGGGTAVSTTYDNTASGLTAENVQDAIDEINEAVSDYDLSNTSFTAGTTFKQMVQALINRVFPKGSTRVDIRVANYGDASAYVGYLTVTDEATQQAQTQEAYRATATITMNGYTLALTMPQAATGGSLAISKAGAHVVIPVSNPINATIPQTFTDTATVSGWNSDGTATFMLD